MTGCGAAIIAPRRVSDGLRPDLGPSPFGYAQGFGPGGPQTELVLKASPPSASLRVSRWRAQAKSQEPQDDKLLRGVVSDGLRPIWILRFPASPVTQDDKLRSGDHCAACH